MTTNEIILGLFALVLVVFSLAVSLAIPRRDPGFPGRNLRLFAVVAVLLVAAMLAAVEVLGAEHEDEEEGEEAAVTETATGEEGDGGGGAPEGDVEAGAELFAAQGCGSCHVLEEAGTSGTVGPNLDESSATFEAAVQQITNGGGGMPAFGDRLSEEEIRNLAAFVVASQG